MMDEVLSGRTKGMRSDLSATNNTLVRDLSSRLLHVSPRESRLHRVISALSRMRYQLAGAFALGVILPALLRNLWAGEALFTGLFSQATTLCAAAVLINFLLYRKISRYPGVDAMTSILPSSLFSFSVIAVGVLLSREEYSRVQLMISFVLVTSWFVMLQYAMVRTARLIFEVIPKGRVKELIATDWADWVPAKLPGAAASTRRRTLPIIADLRADMGEEWERYLTRAALEGRSVYHFKQVMEALSGRVQIDHLSENSFGTVGPDILYVPAKTFIDGALAFLMMVFLSPILLLIGLAIRLESKGPAIFRQTRIGLGGKPFTIYKFRTMRERVAEQDVEDAKTRSDDARITWLGKILRKHRIDELPQLINIIRGEMSFIGPRPEAVALSSWYDEKLPFYAYRHLVRPGITGWAQVNQGHITELDDARLKLEYDFFYVRHLSPWLDFYIVLRTFRVLLTGHGAK
jgi:lipopolysaccharide/colanic/teichoic acid biosynthesis glycosyltransferase